jgi:hypothetical protein
VTLHRWRNTREQALCGYLDFGGYPRAKNSPITLSASPMPYSGAMSNRVIPESRAASIVASASFLVVSPLIWPIPPPPSAKRLIFEKSPVIHISYSYLSINTILLLCSALVHGSPRGTACPRVRDRPGQCIQMGHTGTYKLRPIFGYSFQKPPSPLQAARQKY